MDSIHDMQKAILNPLNLIPDLNDANFWNIKIFKLSLKDLNVLEFKRKFEITRLKNWFNIIKVFVTEIKIRTLEINTILTLSGLPPCVTANHPLNIHNEALEIFLTDILQKVAHRLIQLENTIYHFILTASYDNVN